jgi:hypothetical protein
MPGHNLSGYQFEKVSFQDSNQAPLLAYKNKFFLCFEIIG